MQCEEDGTARVVERLCSEKLTVRLSVQRSAGEMNLEERLSILLTRVDPQVISDAERQGMGKGAALLYLPLTGGCDYGFYLGVPCDGATLELGARIFDSKGKRIKGGFWSRLWELRTGPGVGFGSK